MQKSESEILIVSGQASLRLNLERHFKKKKFRTKTAGSGREAIEVSKSMVESLIIIDTSLPDMPAEHVIAQIRKYWALMRDVVEYAMPRVLVVAASNERLDESKLQRLGVIARLQKPVNIEKLTLFVQKIIEGEIKAAETRYVKVGVMDPEQRSREYFCSILKADDVEITTMKDRFDITTALTGEGLDVIIMEVMGPDSQDPLQYVTQFRENSPNTDIIAICTAAYDENLEKKLKDHGVYEVMTKPVNPVTLRQKVRELVVKHYDD